MESASFEKQSLLPKDRNKFDVSKFCSQFCCFTKSSVEDDVVTTGLKKLCFSHTICVLLWLLSFSLLMNQSVRKEYCEFLVFTPMWTGSLIGLVSTCLISVHVCKNAVLVSRERRMFMRLECTEADVQFIDYDSLPLMRRLFCLNMTAGISYLVVMTTQFLFYLWIIRGIIGVWNALLPVAVLAFFYLVYMYAVKVFSLRVCAAVSVLVFQIALVTLKSNHEWLPGWLTWSEVTLPVVFLLTVGVAYLCKVWTWIWRGKYVLTATQLLCTTLLSIAWLLAVSALALVAHAELSQSSSKHTHDIVSLRLWTAAVDLFVVSGLVTMNVEGHRLASSRGFRDPVPLVQSTEGWEASTDQSFEDSLLLGHVRLRPALSLYQHSAREHRLKDSELNASSSSPSIRYYNAGRITSAELNHGLFDGSGGTYETSGEEEVSRRVDSRGAGAGDIEMSPLR